MFLMQMNNEELLRNFENDAEWFKRFRRGYYSGQLRRRAMKLRRYPVIYMLDRVSPSKNHYVCIFLITSYRDARDGLVTCGRIGLLKDAEGRWCAMHVLTGNIPVIYSHHFFTRWMERTHYEGDPKERLEVIGHYFERNFISTPLMNETVYEGKLAFEHTAQDGVELLIPRKDGVLMGSTFVNIEQLYERQRTDDAERRDHLIVLTAMAHHDIQNRRELSNAIDAIDKGHNKQFGNLTLHVPYHRDTRDHIIENILFSDDKNK